MASTGTKRLVADLLVVDDQKSLLNEVQLRMSAHFGRVFTFSDAADAVRDLRAGSRYGVMLLDVQMEPVTGLELMTMARELDPTVQVLIMTAHGSLDSAIKALKLGALDYVLKPISDWEALVRSIKRAMLERQVRVENIELLRKLKGRNEELDRACTLLRQLNETASVMHAARDVSKVLNLMVRAAGDCLAAERVSVMIRNPANNEMGIEVAIGLDEAVIREVRVSEAEGIAGQVVNGREAIIVDDAHSDERVPDKARKRGRYRGRSFMCIPIQLSHEGGGAKVMGVVNVTDRSDDKPFTKIEVEFVSHLARQAAFAMAGAALWQQAKSK